MRITLKLMGCTMVGLLLLALASHHPASAISPQKPSEALADAMSSHGIEIDDGGASNGTRLTPVAYTPGNPQ